MRCGKKDSGGIKIQRFIPHRFSELWSEEPYRSGPGCSNRVRFQQMLPFKLAQYPLYSQPSVLGDLTLSSKRMNRFTRSMGMSNLHLKQLWQGHLVLCEVPKWGFYSLSPRFVFWIDCCENPHVGRVGMDGQGHTVIVNKEIYSPSALTVDYTNKRIYWADDNHIFFANIDGSQRHRGMKWDVLSFLLSFHVWAKINIKDLHSSY